jgi:hypothetical protein
MGRRPAWAPRGIYIDHGFDRNEPRPTSLRKVLAAEREGDTRVVIKFDRVARSLPDARGIVDELSHRHVKLGFGDSLQAQRPVKGRLAMFARQARLVDDASALGALPWHVTGLGVLPPGAAGGGAPRITSIKERSGSAAAR